MSSKITALQTVRTDATKAISLLQGGAMQFPLSVRSRLVKAISGADAWKLRSPLTEEESSTLTRTKLLLDVALEPASGPEVALPLRDLLLAFPSANDGLGDARARQYVDVLTGLPLWAVAKAVKMHVHGEIDRDHRFAPSPAELKAATTALVRPYRFHLWEIGKVLSAGIDP